jgi:hypothetical protein
LQMGSRPMANRIMVMARTIPAARISPQRLKREALNESDNMPDNGTP